ncbi:hypothetical protein Sbal183_1844 [Shewanella baltica OS183]|nr:hypothetical protein Sbal183_1844 [Shewanella baltica OS183]
MQKWLFPFKSMQHRSGMPVRLPLNEQIFNTIGMTVLLTDMIAGFQVTLNSEGSIYGIAQDHPVFLTVCTRIAN